MARLQGTGEGSKIEFPAGEGPPPIGFPELEVPCVEGEMGGIKYYQATLPLGEIAKRLVYVAEDGTEETELPLEERYQRKLNETRVERALVPYLEKVDHFFPPVVAIGDGKRLHVHDGMLTLPEDVTFPVLDGQHRLAAIRSYLLRTDLTPARRRQVERETMGVVLLDELALTRRQQLFSDLNRNQKVPPKALGILFDQRDVCAVVAKRIAHRGVFTGKVNMESSGLSKRTGHLLSLGLLYEIARTFMYVAPGSVTNNELRPEYKSMSADEAADEIGDILEKVVLAAMPHHEDVLGAVLTKAAEVRAQYLCYTSLGWYAMSRAVARLLQFGMSQKEIRTRLQEIDWKITAPMWEHVVPGGRVVVRRDTIEFAAALIERKITGASRKRTIRRRGEEETEVATEHP